MKTRLSQALHEEEVKQEPDKGKTWDGTKEAWIVTEEDINRRFDRLDVVKMKQQILDDEDYRRRS